MSALSSVIDRYAIGASVFAYALEGLSDEQARARPGPGTWSIAELAAHLADADAVIGDRIKRVVAEADPLLTAFDESAWTERLGTNDAPIAESLALFQINRRWIERILRRCSQADFARAGRHNESGRVTLAELLVGGASHLDHHLRFLYAKRANLGTAVQPRYSYPIS